jgi:4-amino-4-deoxy-L-arabinose transferase
MSWLPLLTAVLVSLPWNIMIHLREPDFWNFFFWNEHVRRFLSSNAQHKATFFYYFITAPAAIMPWTLVTPVALIGIKELFHNIGVEGRLIRLSLCWMVLPFLFFSCASGKLLTYILPCFPPFAILMSFGLLQGLKDIKWNIFLTGLLTLTQLFSALFSWFLPGFNFSTSKAFALTISLGKCYMVSTP